MLAEALRAAALLRQLSGPTATGSGLPKIPSATQVRWASKKQGGSTQNRGGSLPKMLGVKLFGGQTCQPGSIIVRQRGTKVKPGEFVGMGRDHTLYALRSGKVYFEGRKKTKTVSVR